MVASLYHLASDSRSSCSGLHISRLVTHLRISTYFFRISSANGCMLIPICTSINTAG